MKKTIFLLLTLLTPIISNCMDKRNLSELSVSELLQMGLNGTTKIDKKTKAATEDCDKLEEGLQRHREATDMLPSEDEKLEKSKSLAHYLKIGAVAGVSLISGLLLSRIFGTTPKDIKKIIEVVEVSNLPGFYF